MAVVTIENGICICDCVCPTFKVFGPRGNFHEGEEVRFTADVQGSGVDVTYNWSIENGEIISGQGTPEILVRVKRTTKAQSVTATSEIGGLKPACGCPTKESASVPIID